MVLYLVQAIELMGNSTPSNSSNPQVPIKYDRKMFNQSKIVGKGGFGKVWKVIQKRTRKTYALKVIDKARVITKKSVNSIMNQKEILSSLVDDECQFIVNMKGAFQDRQNCYLLMDYLDGGDLRYYINRSYSFSQEQTRILPSILGFMIRCLVEGLNHLHQRNIIHRDIKPENIILDRKGYARITDLGIARYWKSQNSHETSGTPGYMAPEVLLRQNHSFCADLYAVGVIAYEMIVGKRPYAGRDRKTIRDEMISKQAKIPSIYLSKVSKEAIDFVNRLLQRTAKKRLGYNGMSEVLMHPWLNIRHQQRLDFLKQKIKSPITPLDVVISNGLQHDTEPDQIWRENILMLKRPQIQALFQGYDYVCSHPPSESIKGCGGFMDSVPTQTTITVFK